MHWTRIPAAALLAAVVWAGWAPSVDAAVLNPATLHGAKTPPRSISVGANGRPKGGYGNPGNPGKKVAMRARYGGTSSPVVKAKTHIPPVNHSMSKTYAQAAQKYRRR